DPREWEHVSLILRDLEAAPAQCRDEPQRRRDRVRSGQDAVRGRRREREYRSGPGPTEPHGEGPPDELRRDGPVGQSLLWEFELESVRVHVRASEHVWLGLPPGDEPAVRNGERSKLKR